MSNGTMTAIVHEASMLAYEPDTIPTFTVPSNFLGVVVVQNIPTEHDTINALQYIEAYPEKGEKPIMPGAIREILLRPARPVISEKAEIGELVVCITHAPSESLRRIAKDLADEIRTNHVISKEDARVFLINQSEQHARFHAKPGVVEQSFAEYIG